ncbi:hypothetical protein [Candidatus Electronema sp. JM]|uniref:hypothetical protein n=1 Tax=Candidatus Electronema sp. JM TaxID=3401571 RepID=UPI003AA899EE
MKKDVMAGRSVVKQEQAEEKEKRTADAEAPLNSGQVLFSGQPERSFGTAAPGCGQLYPSAQPEVPPCSLKYGRSRSSML